MASVQLEYTFVGLAADPSNQVFFRASEINVSPRRAIEILPLANNRRVAISYPNSNIGYTISFRYIERTPIEQIARWVIEGRTLLLRDNRGNKVYGVVPVIDIEEVPFRDSIVSGTFSIEEIHYSEVV